MSKAEYEHCFSGQIEVALAATLTSSVSRSNYIYIYKYTYTHVHDIHAQMHILVHTYTLARACTQRHITHTHKFITYEIQARICAQTCANTHTRTHTHRHTESKPLVADSTPRCKYTYSKWSSSNRLFPQALTCCFVSPSCHKHTTRIIGFPSHRNFPRPFFPSFKSIPFLRKQTFLSQFRRASVHLHHCEHQRRTSRRSWRSTFTTLQLPETLSFFTLNFFQTQNVGLEREHSSFIGCEELPKFLSPVMRWMRYAQREWERRSASVVVTELQACQVCRKLQEALPSFTDLLLPPRSTLPLHAPPSLSPP